LKRNKHKSPFKLMNLHFITDHIKYQGKELIITTDEIRDKGRDNIIFLNNLSFGTERYDAILQFITDTNDDMCINIKNIQSISTKLITINIIAKYFAVPNQRYFYFKDYFSNHSIIQDIINQHKSGFIVKEIQNDTTTNSNTFSYKIRNLFRTHSYIDVKKYNFQSAHGFVIEYIQNPSLPTLICIGDSLFHQISNKKQYCQNQGNAMVCGILKYFSYYSSKCYCNIIGIIPIIESHQNETFSAVDTIIYSLNTYKPKCIINFHMNLDKMLDNSNAIAKVYSQNDYYLNEIAQLGEKNGEYIEKHLGYDKNKESFLEPILYDKYKNKFVDFGINENKTANGLILIIHLIKHIFRRHFERNKR
jgi:hypothetical protein